MPILSASSIYQRATFIVPAELGLFTIMRDFLLYKSLSNIVDIYMCLSDIVSIAMIVQIL
jgi:hypothetical protein